MAIDLLLKEEVGRQPLGLWRIDTTQLVEKREPARGGLAVLVEHDQFHRHRGLHVEQHRHLRAEADVLCPLPDVERQHAFAFARLAAVDEQHGIFHLEPAQLLGHRLFDVHLEVEEAILDIGGGDLAGFAARRLEGPGDS